MLHLLPTGYNPVRDAVSDYGVGPDQTLKAVFAPAAPGTAEDDGYVFAYVHNPDRGASDLATLAAQDFTAEHVARVHLPARIPLGFHRSWLADHDHERDRQRQTGPAPGTTTAGDSPPTAAGDHPRSPAHTKKEK